MGSSMGARAFPPPYQTATGNGPGEVDISPALAQSPATANNMQDSSALFRPAGDPQKPRPSEARNSVFRILLVLELVTSGGLAIVQCIPETLVRCGPAAGRRWVRQK